MAKAFDTWTVLPHGPVAELAPGLWRVEGDLPGMPLKRQMVVARLSDGRLVVHNPMALEAAAMRELEGRGEVAYLIVPNGWHRLDAATFEQRYPQAKVVCPAGARKKVEQVVGVDATYPEFPSDPSVTLQHLDGVGELEGVMTVHGEDGDTLVFADVLFNVPSLPGFTGWVMQVMGSTGQPKVTTVGKLFVVKDRRLLRAHLERLAAGPVRRLVPGHGDVISENASDVLRAVASRL